MPKKAKRTRVWCRPVICGQEWRAILSTEEECPELAGCEGFTHAPSAQMVIDDEYADTRKDDTLLHEILHATFDASGLRHAMVEVTKLSQRHWQPIEEKIIRTLAPALHATLKPWLSLPPKSGEQKAKRRG